MAKKKLVTHQDEAFKLYKDQLVAASKHNVDLQNARQFVEETTDKVNVISGSLISMEKIFGFDREAVVEEIRAEQVKKVKAKKKKK